MLKRKNNPLVSIIVPIYNVEQYIMRCLKSLLSQTYENIEIILVDDGSTDNCGELCDIIHKKYPDKIIVVHKQNGGLSDARNIGLKIAKGSYIAFVDSDDFISNKMIEIMVSNLQKYNVDMVCVNFQEFSDDTLIISLKNNEEHIYIYDKFQAIKALFSSQKFCNFAWNKLYRVELFENIEFPKGRKMEDLGTTYLLIEKCHRILYNSQKLYYYYQRYDSILHTPDKKFYVDKFTLAIERYYYLKNKYGDFYENIDYIITIIFECYQYIKDDCILKGLAEEEIKYLSKKQKSFFSIKRNIKMLIFRFNKKAYYILFGKKDTTYD